MNASKLSLNLINDLVINVAGCENKCVGIVGNLWPIACRAATRPRLSAGGGGLTVAVAGSRRYTNKFTSDSYLLIFFDIVFWYYLFIRGVK